MPEALAAWIAAGAAVAGLAVQLWRWWREGRSVRWSVDFTTRPATLTNSGSGTASNVRASVVADRPISPAEPFASIGSGESRPVFTVRPMELTTYLLVECDQRKPWTVVIPRA